MEQFESGMTLPQFVERQEDEELQVLLEQEIARAENLAGRRFDSVKVRGVSEMGEAAGRCHMCSGEIEVREDIIRSEQGIREALAHVLVHEAEHAEGNDLEGMTELAATLKTGRPPVPAYREKVSHARHLVQVLGAQEAQEFARSPQGKVLMLRQYVAKRVELARGEDFQEAAEQAAQEGAEHIKMAA